MCRLSEKHSGISTLLPGFIVVVALISSAQGCGVSVPKAAHTGKVSRVTGHLASGKGTVNDRFDDGDCQSCTLLHYAAHGGQIEVAKALLESGADVNATSGVGATPLHGAVADRRGEMARFLLANGATPSLSIRDRSGNTPLLVAAGYPDPKSKPVILATGAVVYKGEKYQSAEELAKILLAAGADPNMPTNLGNTPLHIAAYNGRVELLRLLLASGADPTLRNLDGETAQMLAESFGQRKAVDLLRQHGTR